MGGSGWTGQPSLVVDEGKPYVHRRRLRLQPARIDALTGEVVWKYQFDDIIKSSPASSRTPSRPARTTSTSSSPVRGAATRYKLADPQVAPYRAVTFGSGKELWRLPVPQTACYSRDCDGSGFFLDGRQYIGVESG